MPGPLDALKKVSGIGPNREPTITLGMMPLGPFTGGGALSVLKNLFKGPRVRVSPAPATETLGERAAEFTPIGGEELYNTARPLTRKASSALEAIYQNLLARGGR